MKGIGMWVSERSGFARNVLGLAAGAAVVMAMSAGVPSRAALTARADVPGRAGTSPSGSAAAAVQVTLITGDRVQVQELAGGRLGVVIDAVREQSSFAQYTDPAGDLNVVPADVLPLVGNRLDRRLFNVSALIRDGYTDAERGRLPLIVTYTGAPVALPGTTFDRALPSIGGAAVSIDRSAPQSWAAFLARSAKAADPLAGVERIWLDGPMHASLDESVPLIGAPVVWAQGYDGSGVTIAVVDSGIDESHPDLAGRVVAAKVFSDAPSTTDVFGHGTHVASIAAGSGAASDGQYKGVAYGAELVNAKVLDDSGFGLESWVIAGMEWAATTQRADIVNVSINGGPSDGTDPVSQAVDNLTAQEGALFVVSAGDSGYGVPGSIEAPATADAAFAVGASTKDDELADFSAVGPRLGGTGVKPEVVAPGVAITAARAEGADLGPPVGDDYMELTGTSMAAPHVAGAAALLLDKEPDWTWAQLKSALVTYARTAYIGDDVDRVGGGRVDVNLAEGQTISSDLATIDLGRLAYPHDDGETNVVKVVFTNSGTTSFEDDVVADGAPAGMLTVEPNYLVLDPGESETVTVTVDGAFGDVGRYTGHLALGIPPTRLMQIPLAFEKEPELIDLTINAVPFDQSEGFRGIVKVLNVDDSDAFFGEFEVYSGAESRTLRVPPGTYSATFMSFQDFAGENLRVVDVDAPEFDVTEATEITLDSSETVEVEVNLDEETETIDATIGDYRSAETGEVDSQISFGASGYSTIRSFARPTEPVTKGSFEFYSKWIFEGAQIRYDLIFPEPDAVPETMSYEVSPDTVAQVRSTFHADVEGRQYSTGRFYFRPWSDSGSADLIEIDVPGEQVEWVSAGDTLWSSSVELDGEVALASMDEPLLTYRGGEKLSDVWLEQPVKPAFPPGGAPTRVGDTISIAVPPFADTGDHYGYPAYPFDGVSYDTVNLRLYRGGQILGETDQAIAEFPVPPWPTDYGLELAVTRDIGWWTMSTRTHTRWEFSSETAPPGETVALPLLQVDYTLGLDDLNGVDSPTSVQFDTYAVDGPTGRPNDAVTQFAASWSTDDGTSWTALDVRDLGGGSYEGVVAVPADCEPSCFVSLRVEAGDDAGNTIVQEVERAYTARSDGTSPPPTTTASPTTTPPTATATTSTPSSTGSTTPVPTSTLPGTGSAGALGIAVLGFAILVTGGLAIMVARRRLRPHPWQPRAGRVAASVILRRDD